MSELCVKMFVTRNLCFTDVCKQSVTSESRVRFRENPCEICDGQMHDGTEFSLSVSFHSSSTQIHTSRGSNYKDRSSKPVDL